MMMVLFIDDYPKPHHPPNKIIKLNEREREKK
jgi:hypothetical protein